jgi:16S rRNA (guanine527-N7)-methyltransferase
MLTHHLLDSLAVVAPLRRHARALGTTAMRVLDVGSGAGLPGVVIAICCPEMAVSCVDTVAKKAAFIQQVAVSLRCPTCGHPCPGRETDRPFDLVTSRAFASLSDFCQLVGGCLCPQAASGWP